MCGAAAVLEGGQQEEKARGGERGSGPMTYTAAWMAEGSRIRGRGCGRDRRLGGSRRQWLSSPLCRACPRCIASAVQMATEGRPSSRVCLCVGGGVCRDWLAGSLSGRTRQSAALILVVTRRPQTALTASRVWQRVRCGMDPRRSSGRRVLLRWAGMVVGPRWDVGRTRE